MRNVYFANKIEVTKDGADIVLDTTWISNLSSNPQLGIRSIVAEIDSEPGYQFKLEADYYVQ